MLFNTESDVWAGLLWRTTWQAGVLTAIVLIITTGLRRWITPKWRSVLWLVPACRLLMLLVPASTFSLFNLTGFVNADPHSIDYSSPASHVDVQSTELPTLQPVMERPTPQQTMFATTNESLDSNSQTSFGITPTSKQSNAEPDSRVSVSFVLVGVWLLGCFVAMILWARSQMTLSQVIANGRVSTDPVLVEMCESRRKALRLYRKIQCIVVDENIGPAACGLLHPRILLPSSLIRDLNAEELRTVLVHEIEHVRRWDGVYSLVVSIVTVVHWFNPLAYVICRQLRHQIELAVDASTIEAIGEHMRRSYGELLIQLAQRSTSRHGIAHMAAKRSNLRARINELASPTKASRVRSFFALVAALVLVICGLTDAALTQDAQVQSTSERDQDDKPSPVTNRLDDNPLSTTHAKMIRRIRDTPNWRFIDAGFIERIENRQAELQGTHITVRGVVIDEERKSVPEAFVLLRLPSNSSIMRREPDGRVKDVFAVGWTDESGGFAFENQPTPWFEAGHPLDWEICVFAPGFAVGTQKFQCFSDQVPGITVELSREYVVRGTVKDADGTPIEQLELAHLEIVNPYEGADIEFSLLNSEIRCVVRTDAQGKFEIGGLPRERIVSVEPIGIGAASAGNVLRIATSSDLESDRMIGKDRPRSGLVYPYFEPKFESSLQRPLDDRTKASPQAPDNLTRTVTVHVVNADTGHGVSGVGVGWGRPNVDDVRISPGMNATDGNGVAVLSIPQKAIDIFIGGRHYGFLTEYNRLTTNPDEYTPTLERTEWVRQVGPDDQELELTFEVRPVAPLKITVQEEDGTPTAAELRIFRHGWSECHAMPVIYSDERGQATIAVRPVMFDIDIIATTKSGLRGTRTLNLSKDFAESETAVITVK